MFAELAGGYAVALLTTAVRRYRIEELGIVPRKVIVGKGTRAQEWHEGSQQYFLTQEGDADFTLSRCSRIQAHVNHSGSVSVYSLPQIANVNSGNKKGLAGLLQDVGKELRERDLFYFAVSRHGNLRGNPFQRMMNLGNPVLSAFYAPVEDEHDGACNDKPSPLDIPEFQEMFAPVQASGSTNVLYFEACFGGDFARALAGGNTTTISSSAPGKELRATVYRGILESPQEGQMGHVTRTRGSLEEGLFDGKDLRSAFLDAEHERRIEYGLPVVKLFLNRPHLFVGDIDPSSIRLR